MTMRLVSTCQGAVSWEGTERPRGRQRRRSVRGRPGWSGLRNPGPPRVTQATPDGRNLQVRLIDASNGNIDPLSDISAGATEEMVTAAPRADVACLGVAHDSYPYPT
jgi:hypothetical protein